MRPVEQTTTVAGGGGNCVAACVASIFEVPLGECYPEIPLGGHFSAVVDWTATHRPDLVPVHRQLGRFEDRDGVYVEVDPYVELEHLPDDRVPSTEFWMAYAVSPRGVIQFKEYGAWHPSLHAVVCSGRDVVWDPHPLRAMGIGAIRGVVHWAGK